METRYSGSVLYGGARTVHAEGEISEPVVMLIGLVEAVPMEQFLEQRDPSELQGS